MEVMAVYIRFDEQIGKQIENKKSSKKSRKVVVEPGGYRMAGPELEPARGAKATSGKFGG